MQTSLTLRSVALSLGVVGALVLSGCSAAAPEDSGATSTLDVDAAEAFIAPWGDQAAKEPLLSTPLSVPLPEGLSIAFLDVGTPVAAMQWEILQSIQELTGVRIDRINTSQNPSEITAALNTVVEKGYDGVLDVSLEPMFFEPQLEELVADGVPVTSSAVMNTEEYDMPVAFNGPDWMTAQGAALAAASVARTDGQVSNFVIYTVPEFTFSEYQVEGALAKYEELGVDRDSVRVVDMPISSLVDHTAPSIVVSDLQANPDTEYYIVITGEGTVGLPAALELAGIDTRGISTWSIPASIQQVAAGEDDAALPVDFVALMYTITDQLFREIVGDEYEWPSAEVRASSVSGLLTEENAGDAAEGYSSVQNIQDRYTEIWRLND